MKFDSTYPVSDQLWGFIEANRYLVTGNGKYMVYGISPHLMADVLPTTWIEISKGTVEVEAGTFKAIQYKNLTFDPILRVAISIFVPGSDDMSLWVEDSKRRLTLLYNTIIGQLKLMEVSTIDEKLDELL
jgi:hypothetical protein